MRLMVVDDSNVMRSRISRVIRGKEHFLNIEVVGTASDGVRALEVAASTRPTVVTMDLTMPEMDGIEAISRLVTSYPKIKILVVSALDDKSTAIRALSVGACGFIGKPFSDEELLLALLDIAEI